MFISNFEKTCCEVRYKLVLMDLNMPVMDGFESTSKMIEFMHSRFGKEVLSVIAVTAFVNEENINNCYKVGMVEVLNKPVNRELLERQVQKYYK